MDSSRVVAIIPARGGSKGLPGKNLLPINGRSLLARAVAAGRDAAGVGSVWVTTDAPPIAAEATANGGRVIDRPASISGDTASSEDALLHALDVVEAELGSVDILVFLQCTSPFTTAAHIDGALARFAEAEADSLFSSVPSHSFLWRLSDGGMEGVNHDSRERLRRQDREPEWRENGAIYVMRVDGFRASRHRFFGKIATYEMPSHHGLEIDDGEDLAVARAVAQSREEQHITKAPAALVMDFDGVFTANTVYVREDGVEMVRCHRGDGMGLSMLREAGLPLLILSKERNPVVTARAEKLGVPVLQGRDHKLADLTAWADERAIALQDILYIGNDINDVPCLRACGVGVVVADAHPDARDAADFVLRRPGGDGALRELADLLLPLLPNRSK